MNKFSTCSIFILFVFNVLYRIHQISRFLNQRTTFFMVVCNVLYQIHQISSFINQRTIFFMVVFNVLFKVVPWLLRGVGKYQEKSIRDNVDCCRQKKYFIPLVWIFLKQYLLIVELLFNKKKDEFLETFKKLSINRLTGSLTIAPVTMGAKSEMQSATSCTSEWTGLAKFGAMSRYIN